MRSITKPALLTVPVMMFITLVAVLALWATGNIGANGIGGASSTAQLVWNVEYWHMNAQGEVLDHQKIHNAITAEGLEVAMERLIDDTTVAGTTAAGSFDQIALLNAVDSDLTDGVAASLILDLVDGQNDSDDAAIFNPEDGTYANVGSSTDGDGSVAVTFQAEGNPAAALQMVLGKFAADDNKDNAGSALAAADILAGISISVDLADTDTLTITWTVNIS